MQPFVHLHVHSQFSLLDGQASVKGLVDKAIGDGMSGIALTDHGAMFGIKEFFDYVAKKNGPLLSERKTLKKKIKALEEQESRTPEEEASLTELREALQAAEAKALFKPILGCEVYCARRSRLLKEASVPNPYRPNQSIDNSGWHLVLLAKNLTGYKNLIKMVSRSWIDGYYYRPRIDKELLEQYHEGIIASSACLGGEIPQHIMHGNIEEAEKSILWFKNLFGEDFYLELQRHKTDNPLGNQETYEKQQQVNAVLLELGKKHGVKVIATNDIHFLNEEDAEAHDRLICLSTGKDLNDPKRMRYSKQEWMKTTLEMNELFADVPEVLSTTQEICDKVEIYSIEHDPLMPDFPIPEEFATADDYLRHLTYEGARRKYGEEGITEEVRERIDFELNTISGMGFPGYFLIVQDFIAAARDMGVFVGPGRGSAAGSAVAYCLNITDIDPIRYDLLFERFLNPDRISMPDIDVDFDDDGRADVLHWVTEKYGYERVAHIVTYGTMAAKSAIKDVARVQRLPLSESDRLTKLIPDKIPDVKNVSIKAAIEHVPELKQASLSPDPLLHDTLKYAQMLEGNIRSTGVHACGIIIGKMDISDVVPLSTAEDKATGESMLVTQYEGSVIESTGLIKMDFLGLKTLSVIKEALLNIKKSRGIDIDIDHIPIDDETTYRLYAEGKTVGTFQFESAGMQKYLRELQPTTFEDLIAMNALYRPGPMDYIPDFIDRKHGRKPITYDLECMERYLKDTYG
ncbi:MAG: DNA polymerase III subunit alpha, partial [Porphyromonas sp.]